MNECINDCEQKEAIVCLGIVLSLFSWSMGSMRVRPQTLQGVRQQQLHLHLSSIRGRRGLVEWTTIPVLNMLVYRLYLPRKWSSKKLVHSLLGKAIGTLPLLLILHRMIPPLGLRNPGWLVLGLGQRVIHSLNKITNTKVYPSPLPHYSHTSIKRACFPVSEKNHHD